MAQGPGAPPIPPRSPATPPGNVQIPSAPAANPDEVRLQFPNSDVQPVLKLYEQLTGKRIVTDNTVVGTVNIDISKPVSREEAIRLIETSLYMNGFSLTPAEGNLVKLVGNGKN